jgi:exonuclease SbcC
LLEQARQASRQAGEQRIAVSTLREQFKAKRKQAEDLKPVVEGLTARRAELASVTSAIASARGDLQKATDLAARRPLLEAAEASLAGANAELTAIATEESEARSRSEAEQARLSDQLRELEAEVSRIGAVDVMAQIESLDQQLLNLRESMAALDGRIEALIRSQATRQAECDALVKELAGADATQSRADRLSDEIAQWKLLAKGLGNEGVIALTIDDAGPALTQTVNDLLLACYGMRFTVEIRTQRALATGELREGFEILVHDAENDSTKAVGVMSGGQKVWINECLTRGIALYSARNAGQPYQTLFSDESDGPLDSERKLQFMRMKREVLRQGGYEREFFISQTPDLIAEADAIIDVAALAA